MTPMPDESHEPNREEIAKRIEAIVWCISFAFYLAICLAGAIAFFRFIRDSEWRATFLAVWWMPSGYLAMRINSLLYTLAVGYILDSGQVERRDKSRRN